MANSIIGKLGLITAFILVAGCSHVITASNAETADTIKDLNSLETIYGFEASNNSLKFIVQSTGCTKEKHFDLAITNLHGNDYTITLTRNKKDLCKAMPKLVSVQLALKSPLQNTARLKLNNPFAVSRSGN